MRQIQKMGNTRITALVSNIQRNYIVYHCDILLRLKVPQRRKFLRDSHVNSACGRGLCRRAGTARSRLGPTPDRSDGTPDPAAPAAPHPLGSPGTAFADLFAAGPRRLNARVCVIQQMAHLAGLPEPASRGRNPDGDPAGFICRRRSSARPGSLTTRRRAARECAAH